MVGFFGSRCSDTPTDAGVRCEWESGLLVMCYQVTSPPLVGSLNWCPDELLILTVAAERDGLCPGLAEERGGLSKFSGPG